jgi:hypothetical protein
MNVAVALVFCETEEFEIRRVARGSQTEDIPCNVCADGEVEYEVGVEDVFGRSAFPCLN